LVDEKLRQFTNPDKNVQWQHYATAVFLTVVLSLNDAPRESALWKSSVLHTQTMNTSKEIRIINSLMHRREPRHLPTTGDRPHPAEQQINLQLIEDLEGMIIAETLMHLTVHLIHIVVHQPDKKEILFGEVLQALIEKPENLAMGVLVQIPLQMYQEMVLLWKRCKWPHAV
jgi:hypothetical protein